MAKIPRVLENAEQVLPRNIKVGGIFFIFDEDSEHFIKFEMVNTKAVYNSIEAMVLSKRGYHGYKNGEIVILPRGNKVFVYR